jgi:hypothetical protein
MKHFDPARGLNKDHLVIYRYLLFNTTYHSVNFKPRFLNPVFHLYLPKLMWSIDRKGGDPWVSMWSVRKCELFLLSMLVKSKFTCITYSADNAVKLQNKVLCRTDLWIKNYIGTAGSLYARHRM